MDNVHTLHTMIKDCEARLQWANTDKERAELRTQWAALKTLYLKVEEGSHEGFLLYQ